ncbi:MAG: type IV secretion system DNA-binding domain-containing protein [Rhizobiales bacterium]|nr:type IV secretion system DNA-binding domain-containing protein [Hyphomicrobiales bacterium]
MQFSVLYEPIIWTFERLRELKQSSIRKAIIQKWGGQINPSIFWIKDTKLENENLSSDPKEYTIQKLYLSNLGHYAAENMHNWRTYYLVPIMFLISMLSAWHVSSNAGLYFPRDEFVILLWVIVGLAVVGSTFFGSAFLWRKFLPPVLYSKEQQEAVKQLIDRCLLRDLPENTPDDLKDRFRILTIDKDGDSVSGQILAVDLEYSSMAEQVHELRIITIIGGIGILLPLMSVSIFFAISFPIFAALMLTIHTINNSVENAQESTEQQDLFSFPLFKLGAAIVLTILAIVFLTHSIEERTTSNFVVYSPTIILFGILWIYEFSIPSPLELRGMMLEDAVKDVATEHLIDAAGKSYFTGIEQAKLKQIDNAAKDKSVFFTLGKSTALLSERRDQFAPTEAEKPVGLTLKDLKTHMLVLGTTGTGKTSGVLLPLLYQIFELTDSGIIILDGKGSLPAELKFPNLKIISPKNDAFNPIFGLSPDIVADTVKNLFSAEEKDSFWSNAAGVCIKNAAVIILNSKENYTLKNILALIIDQEFREKTISGIGNNPQILEAFIYFTKEFDSLADNTKSSIVSNVSTWLRQVTDHEILGDWINIEQGVKVEDVLNGGRIGVLLPEAEFGDAGRLITSFVMSRIYNAIKKRATGWSENDKQCFMIVDEAQALIGKKEIDILPIARSLGLSCIFSTQNIDGLTARVKGRVKLYH